MSYRAALGASAVAGTSIALALLLAVTSSAATPSLSVVATDAVIGQTIHATAQLSESPGASGEISFEVFGPDDPTCSRPALTPALPSVSVNGEGEYPSADFTPPEAGTYRWSAHYSGDLDNPAADSTCSAASTVSKKSPGVEGTASAGVVNTAIHDEATVTDGFSPTGEVVFKVYGPSDTGCLTPLETDAVPLQSGSATSADFLPQQAGEFRWTAEYAGDANNEAASTACGAANQSSAVGKASPGLGGTATSAVVVGSPITDEATLTGGFEASGQLVFRAYGPGDQSCAGAPKYEATVPVSGNGPYSPPGFSPPAGLYRWTVGYAGDANNEAASTACGAANQSSAVGKVDVVLVASATGGTVGDPVTATASLQEGAIPAGQITFAAFPPSDANCSGAPAFSSTVRVAGNGSYHSAAFLPTRVGTFRWTVGYSGDPNHAPTTAGCGQAKSSVSQARPSIKSTVQSQLTVGTPFQVTATLQGAYAPAGTVSFQIYGPGAADCSKPLSINTVTVAANGTVRSDPFVARRPGRYSFVASYSGDASNQGATEPCDPSGQAQVDKRAPEVKPRARLKGNRISIRARLSGAVAPSGVINFRLYRPGDKRCKGRPAFSGGVTVKSNGSYLLAQYFATESGMYRLSVGYSGDQRNRRYKGSCRGAQPIQIG
ncbi:MAG TPA: hypothetical protein VFR04_09405 [Solirubrobacterales bacterium]|nr:hypothetical protein [Solirubrobacterales bacterium]